MLPSKRPVVVLQNTAKKYIKARATSETRLYHLVCKISAANPGIKLSGLEMKILIHTCFYWLKKKKKQKKKSCHNINDPMSAELFLLKAFKFYSLNTKSINWRFVCQLCKRWMCDPVNGRLFTVYLSSISVAMVTLITLRRNYRVNNLFF